GGRDRSRHHRRSHPWGPKLKPKPLIICIAACLCPVRRETEHSEFCSDPHPRLSYEDISHRLKPLAVVAVTKIANSFTNYTDAQIDKLAFHSDGDLFLPHAFRSIKANNANDTHAGRCLFNGEIRIVAAHHQ